MRTNNEIREKIVKMYLEGYSINRIVEAVSCSVRTIYKVLDAAGVKGAERQVREADVINITLTDATVVQWLRSQPNPAAAITKLVYSQIEGSSEKPNIQKQNSRIADSTADTIIEIPVTFLDAEDNIIGKQTIHVPSDMQDSLFLDLVQSIRDEHYPRAASATNTINSCTITFTD